MPPLSHSRRANGSRRGGVGGSNGRPPEGPRFVLYVEGPRDQSLLAAWAHRMSPRLGHSLDAVTVILGGCQPARAAEQFRALSIMDIRTARGLCVLDRDADDAPRPPPVVGARPRLLHLEPAPHRELSARSGAIRRSLGLPAADARVERFFRSELPADRRRARRDSTPSRSSRFAASSSALLGTAGAADERRARDARRRDPRRRARLLARVRGGLGLDEARAELRATRDA